MFCCILDYIAQMSIPDSNILCRVQVLCRRDVTNLHILNPPLNLMTASNSIIFLCYCTPGAGGLNQDTHQQIHAFVKLTGFSLETMKTIISKLSSELIVMSACPSNIQANKRSHILIRICIKSAQAPMAKLVAKFQCDGYGVLG